VRRHPPPPSPPSITQMHGRLGTIHASSRATCFHPPQLKPFQCNSFCNHPPRSVPMPPCPPLRALSDGTLRRAGSARSAQSTQWCPFQHTTHLNNDTLSTHFPVTRHMNRTKPLSHHYSKPFSTNNKSQTQRAAWTKCSVSAVPQGRSCIWQFTLPPVPSRFPLTFTRQLVLIQFCFQIRNTRLQALRPFFPAASVKLATRTSAFG
jgi:hypothetical protein